MQKDNITRGTKQHAPHSVAPCDQGMQRDNITRGTKQHESSAVALIELEPAVFKGARERNCE